MVRIDITSIQSLLAKPYGLDINKKAANNSFFILQINIHLNQTLSANNTALFHFVAFKAVFKGTQLIFSQLSFSPHRNVTLWKY